MSAKRQAKISAPPTRSMGFWTDYGVRGALLVQAPRRQNRDLMRKKTPVAIIIFAFAFARFSQIVPANAQHLAPGILGESSPPLAVSVNRQQKDDFIVPSRPT